MCVVSLSFHFIGTQERLSSSSTELRKKKASTAKKAGQQNFMSRKISLVVQKERETEETEIPLFQSVKYRVVQQALAKLQKPI